MISRYVPVSIGEHVDKIAILKIKSERMTDPEKLNNVRKELQLLLTLDEDNIVDTEEFNSLYVVNQSLWDIEDAIRIEDRKNEFGTRFIELAREVYQLNDERSKIKKNINLKYGSDLIEEKSYEG